MELLSTVFVLLIRFTKAPRFVDFPDSEALGLHFEIQQSFVAIGCSDCMLRMGLRALSWINLNILTPTSLAAAKGSREG